MKWERHICPKCGQHKPADARHRSLSVRADGFFYCHRCKDRGRLNERDITNSEELAAISAATNTGQELWQRSISILSPDAVRARHFLLSRRLDPYAVHGADVRFVDRWPRPAIGPTLAFGMRDERGEIVAVQGRATIPNTVTAHVACGRKGRGVYSTGPFGVGTVAITESPLDALSLFACGIKAIATAGTSFPTWLPASLRLAKAVLIATDADMAGEAFALRFLQALDQAGVHAERVLRFRPNAKDVNADFVVDRESLRDRLLVASAKVASKDR